MKQFQTLEVSIDNRETSEIQLDHKDGDSIDDESDTEFLFIIKMLKIEHEYVTPVESKNYQNEIISSNPRELDNNLEAIHSTYN